MSFLLYLVAGLGAVASLLYFTPPQKVTSLLATRALVRVNTDKKIVALSIDDSVTPSTRPILDVLKTYESTATFFVVGDQVKGEDELLLLRDMVRQGHSLGNHGWTRRMAAWLTDHELYAEVTNTQAVLHPIGSKLYRPGSGIVTDAIVSTCKALGLTIVLGDVYPFDCHLPFPRLSVSYILRHVRPGSIIILHDRYYTVDTLHLLLPRLKELGYEVVDVQTLLAAKNVT